LMKQYRPIVGLDGIKLFAAIKWPLYPHPKWKGSILLLPSIASPED